jgi:hypothetical protein
MDKCSDDPKWRANANKELQLPGNGADMFTLGDTLGCADIAAALEEPDAETKWVVPKWLAMGQRFTRDVACGYSAADGQLALEKCRLTCSSDCRRNELQNRPKLVFEEELLEAMWGHKQRFVPARCYVMGAKVGRLGARCMGRFTLMSPMAFHAHGGTRLSDDFTPLYKQIKSKKATATEDTYLETIGSSQLSADEIESNMVQVASRLGKPLTPALRSKLKNAMAAKVHKMIGLATSEFNTTQYMYHDKQRGTWTIANKDAKSGAWVPCMKVQSNATSPDDINGQWYVAPPHGSKPDPKPLAVEVECSPGTEPLFDNKKELTLYNLLMKNAPSVPTPAPTNGKYGGLMSRFMTKMDAPAVPTAYPTTSSPTPRPTSSEADIAAAMAERNKGKRHEAEHRKYALYVKAHPIKRAKRHVVEKPPQ